MLRLDCNLQPRRKSHVRVLAAPTSKPKNAALRAQFWPQRRAQELTYNPPSSKHVRSTGSPPPAGSCSGLPIQ